MELFELFDQLEHISLQSELDLKTFCECFTNLLGIPRMSYDYENETEWGEIMHQGIKYNISRPYKKGTLKKWGNTIPVDCNFGISFATSKEVINDKRWNTKAFVASICEKLANSFKTPVYYHRTKYLSSLENKKREVVFNPI
jgi:hypothetical protein